MFYCGVALLFLTASAETSPSIDNDPLRFQLSHVDVNLDITPQEGDWIIGDNPPDEALVLTQDNAGEYHGRDIFIVNQGRMTLQGLRGDGFRLLGNVYLQDDASFEVVDSNLTWKDPEGVDFKVLAAKDNATVRIDQGSILDLGQVAFFFMYGACRFSVLGGSKVKGTAECVLGYDSVGVLDSVLGVYEAHGGDHTQWTFRNIQPKGDAFSCLIYLLRFTDGVKGIIDTLPDISAAQTHVTTDLDVGTFSAKFEDVNVQAWVVHSNPGSDATIDLSGLPEEGKGAKFVLGVQVHAPFKKVLPRLRARAVNTADLSEALGDRVLKINDTYLLTCQVWTKMETPGEVMIGEGSIVGEGSCGSNTTYTGSNVCFDGSGGMFDISGGLTRFDKGSSFGHPDVPAGISVRVHGDGRLILEDGSFQTEGTSLTVAHNGSVWLKNSYMEHWDRLAVKDNGRVRVAWIETLVEGAEVSGSVDIRGVVDSRVADGSDLKKWTLEVSDAEGGAVEILAEGDSGNLEQRSLAAWDTRVLTPGIYRLSLECEDSEGAYAIVREVKVFAE